MRPTKVIILYAVSVIVLGALIAPWIYWSLQWLGSSFPVAQRLSENFGRVASRALLIVAAAGLWPLLRGLGARSWRELGWVLSASWWRQCLAGLAIGVASFAIMAAAMSLCGARLADPDTWPRNFPSRLPGYLLIGCVVAVMEETLLRGGVQGALQRICKLPTAVVIASGIYSIVHYIKPSRAPMVDQMHVTWLAGFECLAQALQRTLTERSAIVGILTLFLAGCVLGLAFARTKALYLSIGVHAGWVATLKSYSHFTDANKHPSELARWLGTGSIIESIVSWPVLMLLIVVMIYWRRPNTGK